MSPETELQGVPEGLGREFDAWLLDADYLTEEGEAVVRLWVKDPGSGAVFPVFDDTFEPYFYCLPEGTAVDQKEPDEGFSEEELGEALEAAEEAVAELDLDRVERVKRRILGEEVEVVRAVAHHPQDVPELRERARKLEAVEGVREANVPYASRYVVDRGLTPVALQRFEVEPEGDGDGRPFLRSADELETEELPGLDLMAFDCEMLNEGGAPDSSEDEIVIISTATDGETRLFSADGGSEEDLIRGFVDFVGERDPDVLVTYNGDDFDWPYLRDRAEEHGVSLTVGRDGSEPVFRDGSRGNVDVRGRLNVDMYRVAERDVTGLKTKSLEDVAEHLGVVDRDERVNLDTSEMRSHWEERREELHEYAGHDAESTLGIAEELLPLQLQLSRLVHRFPDDVSKMGRGRQVEWFLITEASERGEIVPRPTPSGESYAGGLVLEPEKGLHEDVVCLDFSSMYPSIMIAYNISPDTLVGEDYGGAFHEAPDVGHRFREEPKGFFGEVLQGLLDSRSEAKRRMREAEGESERRLADIRQQTLKVLANSFYGYTGWSAASWYRQECAEATAAWGRELIRKSVEEAEERGYEVLYGDTDSLFLKGLSVEDAEGLAEDLTERLPLELELEDVYEVIFFTGQKKRYAGLTREGDIYAKGLEVQRGDWCELAKEIQQDVLEMLLRERDPEGAADMVRDTVERLKAGEIPLEKLVIRKTLTKRISSYKTVQAHVKAASRLREEGGEISPGEKIGYVIIRGGGNLRDRAYPVEMFEGYEDGAMLKDGRRFVIDTDYYVEKQVVPAGHRILGYFGYGEGFLKGQPKQSKLGGF